MMKLQHNQCSSVDAQKKFIHVRTVIVVPAYNESAAIADTIRDYINEFPWASIVVVDNNSRDNTVSQARSVLRDGHDFLLCETKQGKGYAVKQGLSRLKADVYVMTDGDMTYPAKDARRLFERMIQSRVDMMVGDRLADGKYSEHNTRAGHNFGNAFLTKIISWLAGESYKDVLSGLRVMSGAFVSSLDIRSSGFQLETEINLSAAYLCADVVEEGISYGQRPYGSTSKLSTYKDGIRILMFAFVNWIAFAPLHFFTILAVFCGVTSGSLGYRVITGFLEFGWSYSTTAVAAAAFGIIGSLSFFTGLSLHIQGRIERRRDVAKFLTDKRSWNATVDERLL